MKRIGGVRAIRQSDLDHVGRRPTGIGYTVPPGGLSTQSKVVQLRLHAVATDEHFGRRRHRVRAYADEYRSDVAGYSPRLHRLHQVRDLLTCYARCDHIEEVILS